MECPPGTPPSDLSAYFEHTRKTVTETDIRNHVPNDPGSLHYFQILNRIRLGDRIPSQPPFVLTEPIELTAYTTAEKTRDPDGFRRFRRFTTALALMLIARGWDDLPPNYAAFRLLSDLPPDDTESMQLARQALEALVPLLQASNDPLGAGHEYPFLILAAMVLSLRLGDTTTAQRQAIRVIEAEAAVFMDENWISPGRRDGHFLFCLTWYNQFESNWKELVRTVPYPLHDPEVARVLALFAGAPR